MPIHIRKDEELMLASPSSDAAGDDDELWAARLAGARAGLLCLVLAAAALVLILRWLAAPLVAADKLLATSVGQHFEVFMPAVLLALFGGAVGAVVAWRISSTISFADRTGWIMAVAVILLLGVIGALTALVLFPAGKPIVAWTGLGAMTLTAFLGLYLFIAWTH